MIVCAFAGGYFALDVRLVPRPACSLAIDCRLRAIDMGPRPIKRFPRSLKCRVTRLERHARSNSPPCVVEPALSLIETLLALIHPPLALIGKRFAFVRISLTLVGELLSLVGNAVSFVCAMLLLSHPLP